MKINIGINEKERKEIAEGLSRLLADSYTLYLKLTIFIGTSKGPCFKPCTFCLKRNIPN